MPLLLIRRHQPSAIKCLTNYKANRPGNTGGTERTIRAGQRTGAGSSICLSLRLEIRRRIDILGTLSTQASEQGIETVIVTGDAEYDATGDG